MANENAVRNLIRVDDKTNPTLFRALQLMIDDLYRINEEVFPTISPIDDQTSGGTKVLGPVQNFIGVAYPDNLRLDWDDLDGAFRYQIRMGHLWDTAQYIITTATDVVNIDPVYLQLVYGTYNFILRAMNIDSVLGEPAEAVLIIPVIPAPDLSLEVVISTVLLRWTVPPSAWRIDHYIVYRNGVEVGKISGTFKLLQEQSGGTYTYTVAAVDIVGNISTISASKVADLHDPSEFEFVAEVQSQYNGTYVRTAKTTIDNILGIIGPIDLFTWQQHYVNNGFASPAEQIAAGYPLYFQPTYVPDGTYEEVFDFGQLYSTLTIIADWAKTQLYGSTNITTELSYSIDNIIYTAPVASVSVFATSFRYVKVKWTFNNVDDKSAAFLSNLKVVLNVTLTLDSGSYNAVSTDAGGTLITYNKTFTGISSVTAVATVSLQPLYAVCNAVTKDNFRILVFDSSGNRAGGTINWKARGVV